MFTYNGLRLSLCSVICAPFPGNALYSIPITQFGNSLTFIARKERRRVPPIKYILKTQEAEAAENHITKIERET